MTCINFKNILFLTRFVIFFLGTFRKRKENKTKRKESKTKQRTNKQRQQKMLNVERFLRSQCICDHIKTYLSAGFIGR